MCREESRNPPTTKSDSPGEGVHQRLRCLAPVLSKPGSSCHKDGYNSKAAALPVPDHTIAAAYTTAQAREEPLVNNHSHSHTHAHTHT